MRDPIAKCKCSGSGDLSSVREELNICISRNVSEMGKMETNESFIPGKINQTKGLSCKGKSLLCLMKP